MSAIDVETLVVDLSPDAPCGANLEYDPAFAALETAAQGTPERQVGDEVVPAEEPDWQEIQRNALELLTRTKDLRILVYLARALLHTDGLIGLRDGLAVLRGSLEQHWNTLYPQLDPEDNDDPTMRINTIASLCDAETMLSRLRQVPLVDSRVLGRFNLRDIAIASGGLAPLPGSDTAPPEMSVIDAAFKDCEREELEVRASAVRDGMDHIIAIEKLLTEHVGATNAPDLGPLVNIYKEIQRVLLERLPDHDVSDSVVDNSAPVASDSRAHPGAASLSGQIRSRQDVTRMLDTICEYYNQHEPSSPVPLLLQRAKRLVSKNFMEIMHDLTPDGVAQAETIRGSQQEIEDN